ncbi:MAG: hypothetical protein ABIE70_02900 [bacterium]
MKKNLCIGLIVLVLTGSVLGFGMEDRVTTWADFSYVLWTASSMNHVYFVTTEGITRYNKLTYRWEDPLTGGTGLDQQDIRQLWVGEFDEPIYARTSLGSFEYDELFDRWYPVDLVPPIDNLTRHVARPTILYVPPGFNYFSDGKIIDPHGRSFAVSDVLDDNGGTHWFGTWGLGAATAGVNTDVVEFLPYGLAQNRVNALAMEGGQIWVGGAATGGGRTGITRFEPATQDFTYIESGLGPDFPVRDVNCLSVFGDVLYVGTSDGLYLFDRDSQKQLGEYDRRHGLVDDNVLSLAARADSVWIGTEYGACLVLPHKDSITVAYPANLGSVIVYDIVVTQDEVWFASSQGAFRLTLDDRHLQRLNNPEVRLIGDVYEIEATEDNLWLLGRDGVIRIQRGSGDSEYFPLFGYRVQVNALAVNQWALAIGTDQGLSLVYLDDNRTRYEISTADGLPSNLIYSLGFDGDFLWIGSDRGLTRFNWVDL